MPMTCGERMVRCLCGEPVDRIPFGYGLGWEPWGETLERWQDETGRKDLDPAKELGYEAGFIRPALELGIYPAFERKVIEENSEWIICRGRNGIVQKELKLTRSMPHFLEYPVKNRHDWEVLRDERLNPDTPGRVRQDWPEFKKKMAATGGAVQVGEYPYGVFGTIRDLMGVEYLLIAFYDEPELVHEIMDHLTTLWISTWKKAAANVQIDHIHIWEDMSGRQGSLISPAMVKEFMMPCYDRIAKFAKDAGVRIVSVDTDGDCSELVEVMTKHGINMFFPFEVQAGNDILEYRKKYPKLGIMYGLDKRALARDKTAIDREVDRARRMIEKGRYVPGFDHSIPSDVPWVNFEYACKCIRKICGAD